MSERDVNEDIVVTESEVIRCNIQGQATHLSDRRVSTRKLAASSLFIALFFVLRAIPIFPIIGVSGGRFTVSDMLPAFSTASLTVDSELNLAFRPFKTSAIASTGRALPITLCLVKINSSVTLAMERSILGGKYVFQEWTGFTNTRQNTVSIIVSGEEKTLTMKPIYIQDLTFVYIASAMIALLVLASAALIMVKRRRKPVSPPVSPSQPA